MSGLVIRDKNGENISYSGSQFEDMEDLGEQHLYLRTGNGPDEVVKYALTSKPLNDKYKALRMRISSSADGKEAYIAQRYVDTQSVETTVEYASTRSSGFVSTITNTIQSTTSNATRTATRSVSQNPMYYGIFPMNAFSTISGINRGTATRSSAFSQRLSFLMSYSFNIKSLTFISGALSSSGYLVANENNTYSVNVSTYGTTQLDSAASKILLDICSVTRTQTSKVSNFVESFISNIASTTSTQTTNTSRASEYTSSSSTSTTETFVTDNVDL